LTNPFVIEFLLKLLLDSLEYEISFFRTTQNVFMEFFHHLTASNLFRNGFRRIPEKNWSLLYFAPVNSLKVARFNIVYNSFHKRGKLRFV